VARRRWEYRQRNHARGVWFELRRALAEASHAYVIPEATSRALTEAGVEPLAVGTRLHPAKTLIMMSAAEVASLPDAREIPVGLGADFLAARHVALVRFA
jgi:hypothetical protein